MSTMHVVALTTDGSGSLCGPLLYHHALGLLFSHVSLVNLPPTTQSPLKHVPKSTCRHFLALRTVVKSTRVKVLLRQGASSGPPSPVEGGRGSRLRLDRFRIRQNSALLYGSSVLASDPGSTYCTGRNQPYQLRMRHI